jgi:hypothetical protein
MGAPVGEGAHPTLVESNAEGKLVEGGCVYSEGLTIPEGYTAERVRPREPGMPEPVPANPSP